MTFRIRSAATALFLGICVLATSNVSGQVITDRGRSSDSAPSIMRSLVIDVLSKGLQSGSRPLLRRALADTVVLNGATAAISSDTSGPARGKFTDYRFEFTLLQDTVIPYQPIWLRIAVTNVTASDVPKPSTYLAYGALLDTYVDETGQSVRMPGVIRVDAGMEAFVGTLHAGQTDVNYRDRGPAFFFRPNSVQGTLVGKTIGMSIYPKPGAFADLQPEQNVPIVTLYFTVVAPSDSEIEATRLMKSTNYELWAHRDDAARTICKGMLDRFPQSRLAERAFETLWSMEHFHPLQGAYPSPTMLDIAHRMARMRPESPDLIEMVRGIKKGFGERAGDSLLSELKALRPNAPAVEVLEGERK